MSHLDDERLSLIAMGEPATDDERTHLEHCDECALALAELEYTVAVGRSTVSLGSLEAPPERVWGRIAEELHLSGSGAGEDAGVPAAPSEASPEEPVRSKRRGSRLLWALAASVALILVVGVTWNLVRPTQPLQVASATLDAFPGHPGAVGEAVVVETSDGERQVKVELDASEADGGFREVWLITEDASALVSLGILEGTEGTFDVPKGIDLRDYRLVDISQEPEDGDPAHSGDSIVRGELGFA